MEKATNDRYLVGEFDLLVTNTSNALYQEKTDDYLELLNDQGMIDILMKYYRVSSESELIESCNNDWRFAIPYQIADENGVIPRTPYVALDNDEYWFAVEKLDEQLKEIVALKKQERRNKKRK